MLFSLLYLGKFPGWETSARPLANASENLARRMENRHWGVEFCIGYIRAYPVRASTKNFKFPSLSFPCPLQHLLRQTAGNTKHGAAKRPISQISHNVSDKHPTMHHFVTEMCTHVHISHKKRDWFTVWFVREVYRLRCLKINMPIKKENPLFDILLSPISRSVTKLKFEIVMSHSGRCRLTNSHAVGFLHIRTDYCSWKTLKCMVLVSHLER